MAIARIKTVKLKLYRIIQINKLLEISKFWIVGWVDE